MHIAALERFAGVRFFDRTERPLRLTEAGNVFFRFAKEVTNRTDAVRKFLAELSLGVAGEVTIGTTPSVGNYLILPVVNRILKKHPKLRIAVHIQPTHIVCESVRNADVDFGFILRDKAPEDILVKRIRREELCFFAPSKDRGRYRKQATVNQLREVPFITGIKGHDYTETVDRELEKRNFFKDPPRLRMNHLEGMKEAVRSGLGICILPRFTIERELSQNTFTQINVKGVRLSMKLMLLERERYFYSPSVASLKETLEAALSERSPR
jgi:DNA-binding transcriptional LysR family regulator